MAHSPEAAGNRQKDCGRFFDEGGLLLGGQVQVSVAFGLRSQRRKSSAADSKCGQSGMGVLFRVRQA
jgi:hypothetical protein